MEQRFSVYSTVGEILLVSALWDAQLLKRGGISFRVSKLKSLLMHSSTAARKTSSLPTATYPSDAKSMFYHWHYLPPVTGFASRYDQHVWPTSELISEAAPLALYAGNEVPSNSVKSRLR